MSAIPTSERNGKVVAATLVDPKVQIMLITTTGVPIGHACPKFAKWAVQLRVLHSSASMAAPSCPVCDGWLKPSANPIAIPTAPLAPTTAARAAQPVPAPACSLRNRSTVARGNNAYGARTPRHAARS